MMQIKGVEGGLRTRHHEIWGPVEVPKGGVGVITTFNFTPGKSSIPVLDNLASIYERYQVHEVLLHWTPCMGTSKDGLVVVGIDWQTKEIAKTRAGVQTLNPNKRDAIYGKFTMQLPASRLMNRKWMATSTSEVIDNTTAFRAVVAADGLEAVTTDSKTVGDLWITYDITFQGPSTKN